MMIVKGRFIRSDDMGKHLHHLIAMGWKVNVDVDMFGNGTMYFEHEQSCTAFTEFTEFNTNDWVEIEYNELGIINRI